MSARRVMGRLAALLMALLTAASAALAQPGGAQAATDQQDMKPYAALVAAHLPQARAPMAAPDGDEDPGLAPAIPEPVVSWRTMVGGRPSFAHPFPGHTPTPSSQGPPDVASQRRPLTVSSDQGTFPCAAPSGSL